MNTRNTYALLILTLLACSANYGQSNSAEIAELKSRLSKKSITVNDILSNEKYSPLRGEAGFRDLIKEYASSGKATIVTPAEPGERITVKGLVMDKSGKPLKNYLIYFYHTMADGLYAENKNEPGKPFQGQNQMARLFLYVRTDADGKFEFDTVKPGGYPGESFPAHIHVEIFGRDSNAIYGTELQFYDDPRMDKETEMRSLQYNNLISRNTGSKEKPVYFYTVKVPSIQN
jgi:protocatechuate 3,4-dioxygenase beta subunit